MKLYKERYAISNGQISEDSIRALHQPNDAYRISRNRYDADVRSPELVGQPYVLYVADGSCSYATGEQVVEAEKGELIHMFPGEYELAVGASGVSLFRVFSLPKK